MQVYTGYGTSEIDNGLRAYAVDNPLAKAPGLSVDNPLAKARGLSLRTGAQTMLYLTLIPTLPHITNFRTKYFIQSKVYTDEGGIK